jgi:hypothetical protein
MSSGEYAKSNNHFGTFLRIRHRPCPARAINSFSPFKSNAPGTSSLPTMKPGSPEMPSSWVRARFLAITAYHFELAMSGSRHFILRPMEISLKLGWQLLPEAAGDLVMHFFVGLRFQQSPTVPRSCQLTGPRHSPIRQSTRHYLPS